MRVSVLVAMAALLITCVPSSAKAVQISPLRETRVVAPGSIERFEVSVTNDSDTSATFAPDIEAFQIDPKKGTPIFGGYVRALDWFTLGSDITLAPGETKKLWFSLAVPVGATPESFYLSLFATEQDVRAGTRVGTLLFLHIEGETRESLTLQTLHIHSTQGVNVRAVIENTGEIHVVPRGQLQLKHSFLPFTYTQEINPDKHMILPGEYAVFDTVFDDLPWYVVGKMRVRLDVLYGLSNQTIVHTKTFWRLPSLWIIVPILSILVVLNLYLVFLRHPHEA